MFKAKRGIKLLHDKQGLICFTCLDYKDQPGEVQKHIISVCMEAAGQEYQSLFDVVTTHKSITQIALQYFVGERSLYRWRKKFYELW